MSSSLLINCAFVYEPKCVGGLSLEYRCAHGAQINIGDLTPYLTYGFYTWMYVRALREVA
jgi:hypothetical protein